MTYLGLTQIPLSRFLHALRFSECPDGWRHSNVVPKKCYHLNLDATTWDDSQIFCKKLQSASFLTSIHSVEEVKDIEGLTVTVLKIFANMLL